MPPIEPLNQSNWVYGISSDPLADYTSDEIADLPASFIKFITSDQQAAEIDVSPANNEGYSTGTDWATEQWVERHDVNIPFTIEPSIKMLSRLLKAAMGTVATSAPEVGVALNEYVPQDADTSRQLPAYWFSEQCGSRHDAIYPSCVLEKLTISGDETGRLQASGNWRGSGLAHMDQAPTLINETAKYYLKNTMSSVIRATSAVPATPVKTYACGLQSFSIDIDNAPDQGIGYDPGCARYYTPANPDSGIIRAYHLFGRRKYTGSFTIWLEDSTPELALLRNQSDLNLKLGMTGAVIPTFTEEHLFLTELFLSNYRSVVLGNKNGFVTMQIDFDAFYDETNSQITEFSTQHAV